MTAWESNIYQNYRRGGSEWEEESESESDDDDFKYAQSTRMHKLYLLSVPEAVTVHPLKKINGQMSGGPLWMLWVPIIGFGLLHINMVNSFFWQSIWEQVAPFIHVALYRSFCQSLSCGSNCAAIYFSLKWHMGPSPYIQNEVKGGGQLVVRKLKFRSLNSGLKLYFADADTAHHSRKIWGIAR